MRPLSPLRAFVPLAACALAALALPSCFMQRQRIDRPLDPTLVEQLEPGVSTATDVVQLLGAPTEIVQLGHRSAYSYRHAVTKQTGMFLLVFVALNADTRSDRLWVFFDEADVLTHAGSTLDAAEARWGMPWSKRE